MGVLVYLGAGLDLKPIMKQFQNFTFSSSDKKITYSINHFLNIINPIQTFIYIDIEPYPETITNEKKCIYYSLSMRKKKKFCKQLCQQFVKKKCKIKKTAISH